MAVTNIHEAKTHFSKLIERVGEGEEIIIAKAGKPVAKLVPFREARPVRKPGAWKGKIKILPGFYEADKEIERMFYADSGEPLQPKKVIPPMNYLLDTNILIWWLSGSRELPAKIRDMIARADLVFVSAVSAWEIALKVKLGKLEFAGDVEPLLAPNGFAPLPISLAHAAAAGHLPLHHRDPFDRMLVAQATHESLTLVTSDARLTDYGVPVIVA